MGGERGIRDAPFTKRPRALRRKGVHLDNVALVPASLLPFHAQYQGTANALPDGDVLIVLPTTDKPLRRVLQKVAASLEGRGHHVRLETAEYFRKP
jgi:hypothetical protein